MAIGRGSPRAGFPQPVPDPRRQLYFFSNEKSRERFLANPPEALAAAAEFSWPRVMRGLVH